MCGLAGIWTGGGDQTVVARAMADTIAHRGPDDAGAWADPAAGIALSHCRLAILDLSPAGHQPMASPCGRHVLVFNGEIYNHLDLRPMLGGEWRGTSDTETLVRAIARWGLAATLEQAHGMFALALWDRQTRTLSLARDRMGEKPLYYGWNDGRLVFASELKALRAVPGFANPVAPAALARYLRHNCVPAPLSILERVFKVEPASIVTIDDHGRAAAPSSPPVVGASGHGGITATRYWSLDAVVGRDTDDLSPDEAVDRLHDELRHVIARQMIADTPLGAFLSGGIDSSTIVALMAERSPRPVQSFTIGFGDPAYDEAPHARAVARHLGTNHHELHVTAAEVRDVIPALPAIYDEPFADSSQLPTVLLSRLTRGSVTVALSGDGGDELFCGYNRYLVSRRTWETLAAVPRPLRHVAARAIRALPPARWDRIGGAGPRKVPMLGAKLGKMAGMLGGALGPADIHRASSEEWLDGVPLRNPVPRTDDAWPMLRATPEEQMMQRDLTRYLPDDILTKVDRASMAASLEVRVPLLDHRIVELAWATPLSLKKRAGQGKWLLRQVLYRHVPRELIERPKAGFAVPIGAWLRSDLRDWAEDLLSPVSLTADCLLDPVPIRARWAQHLAGTHDWTASLWGILIYRAWASARA
ncbi:asparagine synthase (glutamine-hydrolyzing) [Sphingomonas sp. Leaf4]|uniref:asparagine synthase (glutamine-hydrolyzing) n=1 Tax=Sphingomonas sp. Leaf4 TaxID=2876553 RepID=UPI001E423DD3|nr:asparagine synthase (glutamine-hydrolyzing) [Sphingomonas sp. Leaf4]